MQTLCVPPLGFALNWSSAFSPLHVLHRRFSSPSMSRTGCLQQCLQMLYA
jgi:hypothetical protein